MKIICKVYPSENTCCGCVDEQLRGERPVMNCEECRKKIPEYEVLQFGHSLFFGDWAMVLGSDGTVEKVKLSRVKEVKTVHGPAALDYDQIKSNMEAKIRSLR